MLPSSSRHGAAEVQGDSLHRWLPWASRNRTHRARQSTEPSTFSVLSVLTDEERAQGIGARNVSFHRVATVREGMPAQAVPRHIVQTGSSWPHALRHHHKWMRSWLDLNPEYEYSFFGDEHARRFVEKHGERREVAAYRRILTGSQRADLFRVIFLKVAGGIYADLDEELRRPMSELFGGTDESGEKIPHRATAVIGAFWPFEFLVFAPLHPILVETAKIMSDNILLQVGLQRNGSKGACKTPHECVIRVTGPLAFTSGVGMATVGHCRNRIRTPRQGECKFASDASLRNMHICQRDKGTIWNSWSCGFARHWDCRNSEKRRSCPTKHYARMKHYVPGSDGGGGGAGKERKNHSADDTSSPRKGASSFFDLEYNADGAVV